MKTKPNLVGPEKTGQGEGVRAPENGRRKFLAAGAGAAIAVLGARYLPAQEKTFGASNPWGEQGKTESKPVKEKAGSRKTITEEEVKGLIENAEKEMRFSAGNPWAGETNVTRTKNFKCEYSEGKTSLGIAISSRKSEWKDKIVFYEAIKKGSSSMDFIPKNHDLVDDELLVFAAGGKLAVCFQDKNFEMPVLLEFRAGSGRQMFTIPNPGKDSPMEQKQAFQKPVIGYEHKDGEITIISAPETLQEGDKVLMVKISKGGEVSSSILEIRKLDLGKSQNPFGGEETFEVPNLY